MYWNYIFFDDVLNAQQILMKLSGPEDNVHILVYAKRGDIPRRRSGDILDSKYRIDIFENVKILRFP